MKIIYAADSFKGSLTSAEANEAMRRGAERAADHEAILIPVSDGGEGLIECLAHALGAEKHKVTVQGPMQEQAEAVFALAGNSAVIEMAEASGLVLSHGANDPMLATTYGTGELIRRALELGARKIILGLGGSATTDGGIGALMALGAEFYDEAGRLIERGCGGTLSSVAKADFSRIYPPAREMELTVLCDVDYCLLGEQGAAAVFSPQKGASPHQVKELDKGLGNFADVLCRDFPDLRHLAGTGAAGGLGYGLLTVFGGKMLPGMQTIMELIRFEDRIAGADLLFTGEGRIDFQSAHGKAPGVILQAAKKQNIPVIVIGGSLTEDAEELRQMGAAMLCSASAHARSPEDAMAHAAEYVEKTAYQAMLGFLN